MTVPDRLGASDLQAYMDQNSIRGEIIRLDQPTPTVPDAARAVGAAPEQIVKTILFQVNGEPALGIAGGTTPIDRRVIAGQYQVGRKQVKIAPPETVLEILGYPVGTVPPFGHRRKLPAMLDQALLGLEEIYGGGGEINALVRMAPAHLAEVTGAVITDLLSPPKS